MTFKNLPIKQQLTMMEAFLMNPYAYYLTGMDLEIVEHIYHLWSIYMNTCENSLVNYKNRPRVYPHKDFFELFYSIKSNLISLCNGKKYKGYPFFHLLGFLPLLPNGAQMLETILSKYSYSDAEEYIEFALLKFDKTQQFYLILKNILLHNDVPKPYFNKPSMDMNPWVLKDLVNIYPNLLMDTDLQEFWKHHPI